MTEKPKTKLSVRAMVEMARAIASDESHPAQVRARESKCMTCPHRWPGDATHTDKIGWCNKCGCGTRPGAALSRKITLSAAVCPLGFWTATP